MAILDHVNHLKREIAGHLTWALAGLTAVAFTGDALAPSLAFAHSKYPNPGMISYGIERDFYAIYLDLSYDISPQHTTMSAYRLTLKGMCNPSNPNNPAAQMVIDRRKSQTVIGCIKHRGRYESFTEPRSQFTLLSQAHINYAPDLIKMGTNVANAALNSQTSKYRYVYGNGIYAQAYYSYKHPKLSQGFVRYRQLASVEPGQKDIRAITLRKGKTPQFSFWNTKVVPASAAAGSAPSIP